ncbi:hypothetical protein AMTR_s00074p00143920 [Amborella trichopoda]|uniref:Uncharacterized protein n=1 Tax=Amborella trichopoda TaxID=13333 RepID=W1NN00_AMBTC|nr:hypothetical protein AMTR_s00074p00143920 [Amborella trichopoda]
MASFRGHLPLSLPPLYYGYTHLIQPHAPLTQTPANLIVAHPSPNPYHVPTYTVALQISPAPAAAPSTTFPSSSAFSASPPNLSTISPLPYLAAPNLISIHGLTTSCFNRILESSLVGHFNPCKDDLKGIERWARNI